MKERGFFLTGLLIWESWGFPCCKPKAAPWVDLRLSSFQALSLCGAPLWVPESPSSHTASSLSQGRSVLSLPASSVRGSVPWTSASKAVHAPWVGELPWPMCLCAALRARAHGVPWMLRAPPQLGVRGEEEREHLCAHFVLKLQPRNSCVTERLAFQPMWATVHHTCHSVFAPLLAAIWQKGAEVSQMRTSTQASPSEAGFLAHTVHVGSLQAVSQAAQLLGQCTLACTAALLPLLTVAPGCGKAATGFWLWFQARGTLALPATPSLWGGRYQLWGPSPAPQQSSMTHPITV